jgi:predicted Zn-dependent protease
MTNFFIGDVYLQQDNVDDAQKYLQHALAVQPNLSDAQIDMAKIYRRQDKIGDAIELLHAVVRSDPEQQDAHYLLATYYRDQGQNEQAKKELAVFEELKRKSRDREQQLMRMESLN